MKLQTTAIGPRAVMALLNRHGVPEPRHVTVVSELLGLKYTAAHRRMNGSVAWELEELERVAVNWGESLSQLFEDADSDVRKDAVLLASGARVPCSVVLGSRIETMAEVAFDHARLVATKLGSQWVVQPAPDVGAGPHFEVCRVVVEPEFRGNGPARSTSSQSRQLRTNV